MRLRIKAPVVEWPDGGHVRAPFAILEPLGAVILYPVKSFPWFAVRWARMDESFSVPQNIRTKAL